MVDKAAEFRAGTGEWMPIARFVVEGEQEGGLLVFGSAGARLRLTIRDAPNIYEVDVSPDCFDAVVVGGPCTKLYLDSLRRRD